MSGVPQGPAPALEMTELLFKLDVVDGWPPVGKEGVPCRNRNGAFEITVPPFFIKNLSVGDVIEVQRDAEGDVVCWAHVFRSARSALAIMVTGGYSIEPTVRKFLDVGCNVERLFESRYLSIDVPAEVSAEEIDRIIEEADEEFVSVTFPSFRHPER